MYNCHTPDRPKAFDINNHIVYPSRHREIKIFHEYNNLWGSTCLFHKMNETTTLVPMIRFSSGQTLLNTITTLSRNSRTTTILISTSISVSQKNTVDDCGSKLDHRHSASTTTSKLTIKIDYQRFLITRFRIIFLLILGVDVQRESFFLWSVT